MIEIQDKTIVQRLLNMIHSTTNLNIAADTDRRYNIITQIFQLLFTADGIGLLQKYKGFRDAAQAKLNEVFEVLPAHQVLAAAENLQTLIANIDLGYEINAHEWADKIAPVQV
jgi:hypothetical protein